MPRNGLIDLLRIIAAFGIVWFHSKAPGAWIGHYGLAIFIFIAVYLRLTKEPREDDVARIAKRLLIPWACWFVVFALINLAQGQEMLPYHSVLAGPSLHLWFLPWLAVVLIGLTLWTPLIVVPVALLPLLVVNPEPPIAQWGHVAPFLLIAVLIAHTNYPTWKWNIKSDYLATASGLMFGVFLVHPIFLYLARCLNCDETILGAVIAFICATGFVALCRWAAPNISRRLL